eukprot:6640757-Alexandrium_andersonii.AAC.2
MNSGTIERIVTHTSASTSTSTRTSSFTVTHRHALSFRMCSFIASTRLYPFQPTCHILSGLLPTCHLLSGLLPKAICAEAHQDRSQKLLAMANVGQLDSLLNDLGMNGEADGAPVLKKPSGALVNADSDLHMSVVAFC